MIQCDILIDVFGLSLVYFKGLWNQSSGTWFRCLFELAAYIVYYISFVLYLNMRIIVLLVGC